MQEEIIKIAKQRNINLSQSQISEIVNNIRTEQSNQVVGLDIQTNQFSAQNDKNELPPAIYDTNSYKFNQTQLNNQKQHTSNSNLFDNIYSNEPVNNSQNSTRQSQNSQSGSSNVQNAYNTHNTYNTQKQSQQQQINNTKRENILKSRQNHKFSSGQQYSSSKTSSQLQQTYLRQKPQKSLDDPVLHQKDNCPDDGTNPEDFKMSDLTVQKYMRQCRLPQEQPIYKFIGKNCKTFRQQKSAKSDPVSNYRKYTARWNIQGPPEERRARIQKSKVEDVIDEFLVQTGFAE